MSESKYQLDKCFVAFIDVLGSSEAIQKDAQASLEVVHKVYSDAIDLFNSTFSPDAFQPIVKIFSDNIVVAVRRGDKAFEPSTFWRIVEICKNIQFKFLLEGWLTRGGIASGSFFADSVMVWGTGLIKAYKLENSIAIFPRIVVDPQLVENPNLFASGEVVLRADKDGMPYVDYIHLQKENVDSAATTFLALSQFNAKQLENNLRARQKWLWFGNYIREKLMEYYSKQTELEPQKDDKSIEDPEKQ